MFEDFWKVLSIDFGSFLPIKKDPYLTKNKRKTETFEGIRSCKIPGRAQRASAASERAERWHDRSHQKQHETAGNSQKTNALPTPYLDRFMLFVFWSPRRLQDGPKTRPRGSKTPQGAPRRPKMAPRRPQETPRRPQDAPRGAQTPAGWPKSSQNGAKLAPKSHQKSILS